MNENDEIQQLRNRIQQLEERIQGLRASRRILMNLISTHEKEKRRALESLQVENQRLKKENNRFARTLMDKNIHIVQLQYEREQTK